MAKDAHAQLELFSQINTALKGDSQISRNFFSSLKKHEKTVLVIIGFIVYGIVSFCFGIEKGKNSIRQAYQYHAAVINTPAAKPLLTPEQQPIQPVSKIITTQEVIVPAVLKTPSRKEGYTIQLVTFQSNKLAQKEAEALRKKGLSPLVISRGNYVIVCVGSFSNKDTARSLLSNLKKRYRDCFIRRL